MLSPVQLLCRSLADPTSSPLMYFAQNLKECDLRESPTASKVITGTDGQPPGESVYLLYFLREAGWLQ